MGGQSHWQSERPSHLFEQIIDAHPTALLLSDFGGKIRYANRRANDLFGFAAGELTRVSIASLLPDHVIPRREEPGQEFRERQLTTGTDGVVLAKHKAGYEFPVEVTWIPITAGDEISFACAVVDRTDRSAAESALTISEARLRDIIDNTTAVIYVKDLEGRYQLVNSQWERLFRISRERMRGLNDFEIFPDDMARAFRENDAHVVRSGEVLEIDEVAPHDDGPHTYVSVKFPLRDEQGKIYAVAGISTDITDRVRAEASADKLQSRLQLILNAINNGIVGLNRKGMVTFVNPTAERLLQAKRADIAALLPTAAIDMARRTGAITTSDQYRPVVHETSLRRADGISFPAEFEVHPVVEHGQQRGAVVTLRDVTDRKRREDIERELKSARAVQQILYPQRWPRCPGLDIAGHVYPAESMCGDYLDFIQDGEDEITIAVGDVSGHGFGASLQMVETRACLRAMLRMGHSLAESITLLNNVLSTDIPPESFITLFAAAIDISMRTLTYVAAGHSAWLFRFGCDPVRLASDGLVLGVDARQHYASSGPLTLQSGDILLMPTDGIQETHNNDNQLFGIDHMLQTVETLRDLSACEIVDGLYQATISFATPRRPTDDLTIAVMKVV